MLTARRASADPCSRRGNHASGTPSVRPSSRRTHIWSSSKSTLTALAEVLMPRVLDLLPSFLDDTDQPTLRPRVETQTVGEVSLRIQPELGVRSVLRDVD